MPQSFFVTATGTDIGKTHVVCQLIQQMRSQNRRIRAIKPIISGLEDGLESSDTGRILRAMGKPISGHEVEAISPFRFLAPLSPDMAAHREGKRIEMPALLEHHQRCHTELGEDDILLVEGVGGAFVPLNERVLVVDWILALQAPVILVCGSYLGTLSHTIATTRALQELGVAIRALVMSESEHSPVPLSETRETLSRFISAPIKVCPRNGYEELISIFD